MVFVLMRGVAMDLTERVFRLFRAEMDFRVRSKVGFEGLGFEGLVLNFKWEMCAVKISIGTNEKAEYYAPGGPCQRSNEMQLPCKFGKYAQSPCRCACSTTLDPSPSLS